jgi:hypothetical protein
MGIYTMRFSNEYDYERWYSRAGTRVNVLTIRGAGPMFQASLDQPPASRLFAENPVVVRYRTTDPALVPPKPRRSAGYNVKVSALCAAGALVAAIGFYALI